jgi:hypothetical protein
MYKLTSRRIIPHSKPKPRGTFFDREKLGKWILGEISENQAKLDPMTNKIDITTKPVLTFDEACEYSGYKPSYMKKLTSQRLIPHSKPNKKSVFFDRVKLEEWLMSKPVTTADEMTVIADNYVAGRILQTG